MVYFKRVELYHGRTIEPIALLMVWHLFLYNTNLLHVRLCLHVCLRLSRTWRFNAHLPIPVLSIFPAKNMANRPPDFRGGQRIDKDWHISAPARTRKVVRLCITDHEKGYSISAGAIPSIIIIFLCFFFHRLTVWLFGVMWPTVWLSGVTWPPVCVVTHCLAVWSDVTHCLDV